MKGEQLFFKGKYQEAIKDLDKAIKLDPERSSHIKIIKDALIKIL